MDKINNFLEKWGLFAISILLLLLLSKSCGNSSRISYIEENIESINTKLESIDNKKQITDIEIQNTMEKVMLDFLIIEDEIDKNRTTISQVKQRIENN